MSSQTVPSQYQNCKLRRFTADGKPFCSNGDFMPTDCKDRLIELAGGFVAYPKDYVNAGAEGMKICCAYPTERR